MSKILIAEPDVRPMDKLLGSRILEKLHQHYPGWTWVIDIPAGQNAVMIRNHDCDPYGRMAYLLYKDSLYGDPMLHKVMRAGGDLLERYRMEREGYSAKQMEGRIMLLERPEV